MTDETLEGRLEFLSKRTEYKYAPMPTYKGVEFPTYFSCALGYINRLKSEKQLAETQLKELLSAFYQRTEKPFTLERKDIVELAKDYGIKEEELK